MVGSPLTVTIRPATREDAGEILTVQRAAFLAEAQVYGDPLIPPLVEDLAGVVAAIAEESTVVLVAEQDRPRGPRVVGSVRVRVEDGTAYVGRIVVAPDLQRAGLGGRLLAAAEDAVAGSASVLELFTGGRSESNVRFYVRAGYVPAGTREDANGNPLVVLRKPLS